MKVVKVENNSALWNQLIEYTQNCSWEGPGKHHVYMMKERVFSDWESIFCCSRESENYGGDIDSVF